MITLQGFPLPYLRLGNHLFQLASAYAVAKRIGTKVVIPSFPYEKLFPNFWDYFERGTPRPVATHKDNTDLSYKPIPERNGLSLEGYFQSEKYFWDCQDDVRKMFAFANPPAPKPENIIALNIRGGDYLTPRNKKAYTQVGADYYKTAITLSGCDTVHVYTDDRRYAESIVKPLTTNAVYFEPNAATNIQDMTAYKYLATTNSTYSWWAGWLNAVPNSTVYCPSKWFNIPQLTERDIISKRFIVL